MGAWTDWNGDEWEWDDMPAPQVDDIENPVIHELLGPDGKVIRQWTARPSVGFR